MDKAELEATLANVREQLAAQVRATKSAADTAEKALARLVEQQDVVSYAMQMLADENISHRYCNSGDCTHCAFVYATEKLQAIHDERAKVQS